MWQCVCYITQKKAMYLNHGEKKWKKSVKGNVPTMMIVIILSW